jgi:hypothetical protein
VYEGGLYRFTAFVQASATTMSAVSRPFYVRFVNPDEEPDDAQAPGLCSIARSSTGAAAFNARTACEGAAQARRSTLDTRTFARRLLGR